MARSRLQGRSMVRCLPLLWVALATGAAAVDPAGDPLESAACREALRSLDEFEAQASAAASAPRAHPTSEARPSGSTREALHRRTAQACLRARADPPAPPGRIAQPPLAVAPVASPAVALPPGRVGQQAFPPGPSLRPAEPLSKPVLPPTTVVACDRIGCWASDGTRLNRVGPNLLGPRGLCSVQGALLHCP